MGYLGVLRVDFPGFGAPAAQVRLYADFGPDSIRSDLFADVDHLRMLAYPGSEAVYSIAILGEVRSFHPISDVRALRFEALQRA